MSPVSFKCGDVSATLHGGQVYLVHHYISESGRVSRTLDHVPVTSIDHAVVALQRAKEYAELLGDIAAAV